jgi:photosystem II stability/assembly factor-like uncharacterized protein
MKSGSFFPRIAMSFSILFAAEIALSQSNFWQKTNGPGNNETVYSLVFNSSGEIFAGAFVGVFHSTNNGDSWTQRLFIGAVLTVALNANGHIFAGTTGSGVYRSTDNGSSWTRIGLVSASPVIAFAINASGHIFAATGNGGVFRSRSNGDTWVEINTGLPNTLVRCFAINASEHIFAGAGAGPSGHGVFRSMDNGDNWTQTGLTSAFVLSLNINANGHIFAGTTNGVFRSTDNGGSWTPINMGLANSGSVRALAINMSGHIFAGSENGGVFISTDNGDNWTQINTGLTVTNVRSLAINSNGYIFAGTQSGGVFRSVKSTIVPAPITPTLAFPPDGAVNQPTMLTLNWNPSTDAETYRLQVSTNSDFSTTVVDDSTITATSQQVGPLANDTTYYWRVRAKNIGGISTWSSVWSFKTIIAAPFAPTLASPPNGAGNQPTTLTLSWNPSTDATTYRLQVSTSSPFTTTIFDDSTIATTSWQVGPLTNNTTYYWRVNAKNAGGTSAWSPVWSFMTGTTAVSEREKGIPTEFGLSQNYPNPFNPSTTILYALPKTAFVKLTVFNPLGKEVETLVSTTQVAGKYEIHWNPNNLPSGVYLYRLRAGKFVETRKMVFMR